MSEFQMITPTETLVGKNLVAKAIGQYRVQFVGKCKSGCPMTNKVLEQGILVEF